ncbi:MAG: O-acetyl-ADP-ribose deacetylase [candidate division Zixibacteria bacterium CG_4_9_14_3_um_filter_46_8]|nr:MAG: O-acetyl-ADP-ribose deacetylase [candidate division Zixibacteria bacterium CG_4_9_14_3_um_filter_46_8]
MSVEMSTNNSKMRLMKGDITNTEIEAFVFYARPDLQLGSGFGGAITVRGGASIQEELKQYGEVKVGDAVITSAGKMKAKYIIHAVGPRFQEKDTESKLRTTTLNVLKLADQRGIRTLAMPAMGVGFYGVPLDISAQVTLSMVKEYLRSKTGLEEVVFCVLDNREYNSFYAQLAKLGQK